MSHHHWHGGGLPEIKRRVVAKWASRGKLKPTVCPNIKTHVTLPFLWDLIWSLRNSSHSFVGSLDST
jgi:hypothetical protein